VSDDLRRLISTRAPAAEVRELADAEGFAPIRRHAAELVQSGITSFDEVLRAVHD
jgi:type II secretory ATPase GspE/PulE/Tfp pilus assembly ATPase PilB-like protein